MMRTRVRVMIAVGIISLFASLAPVAYAYTSSDIVPIISTVNDQATKVNQNITSNSSLEEIRSAFSSLSTLFSESSKKVASLTPEGDAQTTLQQNIVSSLDKLAADADTLATTQDPDAYKAAAAAYDADVSTFNASSKEINTQFNLSTDDYTGLYVVLVLIFSSISIGLLIASKISNKLLQSAVAQDALQFELFKSSLWPTIGSIVTLIWYKATPPGGTYYILWGPMAFGAFYFLRGYSNYLTQKKGLKKLQKEETNRIKQLTQNIETQQVASVEHDQPNTDPDNTATNEATNNDFIQAKMEIVRIGFKRINNITPSDDDLSKLSERALKHYYDIGLKHLKK